MSEKIKVSSFKEYQLLAARTSGHDGLDRDQALINWTLGLAGEAGEFANMIKKNMYHGHVFTQQELAKELGDVLWYLSALCSDLGLKLEDVASLNLNKLAKRYPNGFSQEDSINRKD